MGDLADFLRGNDRVVRIRLARVQGSAPREAGAEMFVSPNGVHGTIGGGQLEYMVIDKARRMLASGEDAAAMDVPLGPEIGQCCGGRVEIALTRLNADARKAALAAYRDRIAARPLVHILGAGHVGRALAALLVHMPVRAILIDGRAEELALCSADVEKQLSPMPEAAIRAATPASAFIVLTHDHALDFLLTAEALSRGDAAYVGLIGSATKRARFERFCAGQSPRTGTSRLVCPIGATGSADKRPEVIAAFVAAEVMAALTRKTAQAYAD